MKALKALLNNKKENLPKWVMGRIPHHYKRITCSPEEAIRLATIGQAKISAYFGDKLFFTQAVIAGACLSGDYDTVIVVTSSQYGKALDDDTPVLTRNGWKRHGDLKVGDEVVGIDGEFKKVLYVHPKCEMDRIVVLENGDEFICHHNHEWIYKTDEKVETVSAAEMEKQGLIHNGQMRFVTPNGIGISEIKHTSGVQGNCITVEGGIYCVGKHMIPTHNSWLFGRIVPINAFEKKTETFVAGGDSDKTGIITSYMFRALQQSAPEMRNSLNSESKDKLDKLATSVSKTKISFKDGGSIEPLSLGEHYNGELSRNKSVGRGGDYFVDEAALLSEETFAELGRRDFKSIDGTKGLMALISNPHKPGVFYDKLTEEDLDARTLVIWMDILTAVEEERTTEYNVLHSDFAKNKSTRKRYLMCELDTNDDSMFGEPKVYTEEDEGEYKQYFIGVDPAYKGKDTIEMAVVSLDETGFVRVEEIEKLHKSNWRDGGTSEEIIRTVVRKAKMLDAALMCIDVGWGVWLVEGVVRRNVACRGINFGSAPTRARVRNNEYAATNAARMRDEMHIDLQTLIDDEMIAFHKDAWDKVKEVFPFVTCSRNQSGNIQVRKKSEIKKSIGHSPDELDAVLLAIHAMMIAITGTPHFITGHE